MMKNKGHKSAHCHSDTLKKKSKCHWLITEVLVKLGENVQIRDVYKKVPMSLIDAKTITVELKNPLNGGKVVGAAIKKNDFLVILEISTPSTKIGTTSTSEALRFR